MANIFFGANCLPKTSILVNGQLFGRTCTIEVDSILAKLILTEPENEIVQILFKEYDNKPISTQMLSEIYTQYSMDVSTLYFLKRTYNDPKNKEAQDLYLNYFDQLTDSNFNQQLTALNDYYIAFVPGLNYLDKSNGGDFARQRQLLSKSNIKNELILTGNWGETERNAVIISNRLRELNEQYKKIIIVSASKGGLDVSVAIGKILREEEIPSIKAWVSVGGILKGSPLADTYLMWPKCWIAEIGLLWVGKDISLIRDMSYHKRKQEFTNLHFPEHIKRIHFVGAPLSTQIHNRIKSNYSAIKKFGPNDGITPLADEVTEGGIIISELGFDHYYKHPEIEKKTIALALTIASIGN